MAIPEEDLGPAWLRDYQYIEADIQRMDEFAKTLRTEVETNYVSHLTPIYDDMGTPLPAVNLGFAELFDLMETHKEATEITTHQVHDYANRSSGMAHAASEISSNYAASDAFAQANVTSVREALNDAGVTSTSRTATETGQSGGTVPATTNPEGN